MNTNQHEQLEQALRRMTTWPYGEVDAWKQALEQRDVKPAALRVDPRRLLLIRPTRLAAAAILILVVGSLAIGLLMTVNDSDMGPVANMMAPPPSTKPYGNPGEYEYLDGAEAGASRLQDGFNTVLHPTENAIHHLVGGYSDDRMSAIPSNGVTPTQRSVVRKATIELRAEDVRAAFLKAQQIVSEASGEFIEQSSLTGSDDSTRASLTLRIRADRLSEVLGALRPLGEVVNEQLAGEDVTAQVVDIDARLRAERQVEKELLELLDSRPNAEVKDILTLRSHLQQVRGSIERMVAQQQRLHRLVSLATVLVIIYPTPDDGPKDEPKEESSSLSDYFTDALSGSWTTGLHALTDSIAFAVRIIVGGAIWWALAITALVAARTMMQRRIAAGAV